MKNNPVKIIDIYQIKPIVHKKSLLLISGILWTGIGIYLSFLAYTWLLSYESSLFPSFGLFMAIIIHTFGFSKIAKKNINRIKNIRKSYISIFAFQSFKSYVLIGIMMALGAFLRQSFIPKNYLSIIYLGIGGALFLSSLYYYKNFFTKHDY